MGVWSDGVPVRELSVIPQAAASVDESGSDSPFRLSPNPAVGTVRLGATYEHVEVIDLRGGTIVAARNTDRLDVNMLRPGAYLVRVLRGSERRSAWMIRE